LTAAWGRDLLPQLIAARARLPRAGGPACWRASPPLKKSDRRQGPKAPPRQPKNRLMMNSTRKMKNNTCAMLDAVAAMPPNPKIPATMATTRKSSAQYNIMDLRPGSRTTSALQAMTHGFLGKRLPRQRVPSPRRYSSYLAARFLLASRAGGANSALLLR